MEQWELSGCHVFNVQEVLCANWQEKTITYIHTPCNYTHTPLFSTLFLFDVYCSRLGSRFLSIYSDWSQCVSGIRQWLCSQNEDFHSCFFLVGFFPLSHLNWLLLLPKLAVTFCIFVLDLSKRVYLRMIVQFGKFKQYQKGLSFKKVYL